MHWPGRKGEGPGRLGPEEETIIDIKPVLDRMYADREIYCIQPWCVQGGKLTPARLFIGMNEQPQVPACCDCARHMQDADPNPIELWYIDDDLRERWWAAIDGAIGASPPQPPPPAEPEAPAQPAPERKPVSKQAWRTMGLCALASLVFGIVIILRGESLRMATPPQPNTGTAWIAWGVFFIILPLLVGIGWVIVQVSKSAAEDARKYKNWKSTLPPQQQNALWWAETGAMWAAYGAAHHAMHERREKATAQTFERVTGVPWDQRWR